MTPEDILDMCDGHKLILHKGEVFFNTRDLEEARRYSKLGCDIRPWYTQEEIDWRRTRGYPVPMGYEVHLRGALAPIWEENEDGDQVEISAAFLYESARART